MHRLIAIVLTFTVCTTWAQSSAPLEKMTAQDVRRQLSETAAAQRSSALMSFMERIQARVAEMKQQDVANPALVELIELRLLLSPIALMIKKAGGARPDIEACEMSRHEVNSLENFGERSQERGAADAEAAEAIIRFFCPSAS